MAGYCDEADVSARTGVSDYTASTTPTQTEVETFIDNRAGEIYAKLRSVMGDAAPGPTGYSTTINTGSDAGLALSEICESTNAIGAAVDALQAGSVGESPARSERVSELWAIYQFQLHGDPDKDIPSPLMEAGQAYLGGSTYKVANSYTVGEVTDRSITSVEEQPLPVDESTLF